MLDERTHRLELPVRVQECLQPLLVHETRRHAHAHAFTDRPRRVPPVGGDQQNFTRPHVHLHPPRVRQRRVFAQQLAVDPVCTESCRVDPAPAPGVPCGIEERRVVGVEQREPFGSLHLNGRGVHVARVSVQEREPGTRWVAYEQLEPPSPVRRAARYLPSVVQHVIAEAQWQRQLRSLLREPLVHL